MSFDGNVHTYKLVDDYKNKKKTFKDTFDLNKIDTNERIDFTQDISGQVVYSEKGANVVITAYDTQEVTYKKISTTISSEKETTGKNKGKYKVTTITYNATYNDDGEVNGFDEGTEKVTYAKKAGTGEEEVVYQTLNSKNKVIAETSEDVTGENKTIVNKDKVLGTITYKNGQDFDKAVLLNSVDYNYDELFGLVYAPQKSGNKYTGTWLKEEVDSTKANETFNLGVNRSDMDPDIINYDLGSEVGHGKDTLTLAKGSRVNIALENDGGLIKTFTKSGNNVTMALGKSSDYDENPDYRKEIMTVTKKSSDKYNVNTKIYVWNEELDEGNGAYELALDETEEWPHESIVLVGKYYKETYGVDFHVGTNVYYLDEMSNMYQGGEESLAKITFKNYLKLAQDGVTLNDASLKEILEGATGVGILGNKESTKKQKLTGTFLQEQFHGGTNNDTITTGDDTDFIYLSGGKDTITVNGSGGKGLYFDGDPNLLGQTTVKFAKGISFDIPEDDYLPEDKTSLNLSAVYNKDDFNFRLVKSGNDLVLDTGAYARALNAVYGTNYDVPTATLTVSDFFAKDGALEGTVFGYNSDHNPMTLNDLNADEQVAMYQFGNAKKANKMSDTIYGDMLIGGNKADKFTVSNGDAQIFGLKGNDTIDVVEGADGTVTIAETMGSGNDTLTIDPEVGDSVEFMVAGQYSQMMSSDKADISFEKTGNDLTFNMTYFKDAEAGIKKDINDSLTIKDFFNNSFDIGFGYNGEEPDDLADVLDATHKSLIINGQKITKKGEEDYGKTAFYGTKLNDSMTYAGKGDAAMYGGGGNDEYNVKLSKNTDIVMEDDQGKNTVNLGCSYKDLRVFFNADKYGIVTTSGDYDTDYLFVFSKDSFTQKNIVKGFDAAGKVDIDDFFTFDEEEHLEIGAHFKFTATDSDEMAMDGYVTTVASSVAGWLSDHTGYADAVAVFEGGNKDDINSLIQAYNIEYDPS